MTDDNLERDLRRVLADPGHRLPDRLVPLERVHAGAARRRRRHQALTASLAVLAVVGIGLGVARPWAGSPDDSSVVSGASSTSVSRSSTAPSQPSASVHPSTTSSHSSAVSPAPPVLTLGDVSGASSVTAIDDRHWWVAAQLDCSGCLDQVLRTTDDGATFSFASSSFGTDAPAGIAAVRYVDPTHGTLLSADGSLLSTKDGGRTWTPLTTVASFFALEAGGSRTTYALQHSADDSIHLWSKVADGPWKDIATLDKNATVGAMNVQLAVEGNRAVVVWRTSKEVLSGSYEPTGGFVGTTKLTDCDPALGLGSISSGRGAIWLTCATGTADAVLTSQDYGATWGLVPVPGEAGRHVVGAIDANHAVISTANGLGVLRTDETLTDATLPRHAATGDWSYIGFTNPTHGFALTGSGDLLRSTDGGHTWKAVTYAG